MKPIPYHFTSSIMMITLLVFISLPAVSSEETGKGGQDSVKAGSRSGIEEKALDKARSKLGDAFDKYKQGDISATKNNLKQAAEWLNKAAQNSTTEKAREEARKLAVEIKKFKTKLNHVTEQQENGLVRFWHRTTSLIKRETDHLIHSYVELSISEKTLKHLLDAKMHLFTAEHDLFVSHEAEDAHEELARVLSYLQKASQVSTSAIKIKITALSKDIQLLKNNITSEKEIWHKDSVIHALDKALKNLAEADKNATPTSKLRIKLLKTDVLALRADVARSNVKNNYETAMASLQNIINELK